MQLQTDHNYKKYRKPLPTMLILLVCIAVIVITAVIGLFADQNKPADNSPWDPVSKKVIDYAIENNPPQTEQKTLLLHSAVSLVGKVPYFWGGKSKAHGWDSDWGKPTEVTSEGSSTTGTVRPKGLDCSGFVTWCFIQTGYSWEQAVDLVGNGTANQFKLSDGIAWNDLQPGDLAFQNEPGDPEGNHVGICIGFDRKNEPIFIHCSSSENNVVATHADGVFEHARRPKIYQN